MKKTLIITIIIIIGIVIYLIYLGLNKTNNNLIEDFNKKTVADLIQEQEFKMKVHNKKLDDISKTTDFDPEKTTLKEVGKKLDSFIQEIE